jgi:hypothetical protein
MDTQTVNIQNGRSGQYLGGFTIIKQEEEIMKKKTYQTLINLLIEARQYQRLRMTAQMQKTSMSKLVREGIDLKLAQVDKENKAINIGGE